MVLSSLFMIITKRIPEEVIDKLDQRTFKIDNVYSKINLVNVPDSVVLKERTETKKIINSISGAAEEQKVKVACNLDEKALCRIRIPLREQTASEYAAEHPPKTADIGDIDPDKNDEVEQLPNLNSDVDEKEPETKLIEENQDDKVVMCLSRTSNAPYSVLVINQYAQRQHRGELITAMVKSCPDWFENNSRQQDIAIWAEEMAEDCE